MKYIALHGPAYSGKTSLAREMERRGYMYISFTDLLKTYLVRALAAVDVSLTVQQIHREKEKYRPLLQEFSKVVGWQDDPMRIHEALAPWYEAGRPSCVFDNVRDLRQAEELLWIGFEIVELTVTPTDQARRAKGQPLALEHPIEQPLPDHIHRKTLDATYSTAILATMLEYGINVHG